MSKDKKVLDLDALFTSVKPIEVRFLGQSYNMLRPIDLSPEQLARFESLTNKMQRLGELEKKPEEYTADDANFVEDILDQIILTVCEELPVDKLPFMAKVYVIKNYQDELAKDDETELKKEPA